MSLDSGSTRHTTVSTRHSLTNRNIFKLFYNLTILHASMQVSDVFTQAMALDTSQAKLKALIKGLVKSKLMAHAR